MFSSENPRQFVVLPASTDETAFAALQGVLDEKLKVEASDLFTDHVAFQLKKHTAAPVKKKGPKKGKGKKGKGK